MLAGGINCLSCNMMIDKLKEKEVFKKYSGDYIFYKCNVMDSSNVFLHYILLMEQIPNNYIFNEKGELVYASFEHETVSSTIAALLIAKDSVQRHCFHSQFPNLSSENILKMHNYTIKAYMNYKENKDALSYIDSSVNISPYFYNLYLKYKIMDKLNCDQNKIDSCAKMAISYYKPGYQALLYKDIYLELKNKYPVIDHKEDIFAKIEFDNTEINCGELAKRNKYKFSFTLKNVGEIPLIIYAVKVDCDCLKLEYQKQPIMSNKESVIEVSYSPESKGFFKKDISILTNSKEMNTKLSLTGTVK